MGNIEYGNHGNMGIYGNMLMECRECGNVLKYGNMFMGCGTILKYLIFRPIPGRPWVIIITPKSGWTVDLHGPDEVDPGSYLFSIHI